MLNQATVVGGSGTVQGGAGSVQSPFTTSFRWWSSPYYRWWAPYWPGANVWPQYCPPGYAREPYFNTCVPSPLYRYRFGYAVPYRFSPTVAVVT